MPIDMLCALTKEEYNRELRGQLIGVYKMPGYPDKVKVANNFTNRIVLGFPLHRTPASHKWGSFLLHGAGLRDFQKGDVLRMVNSNAFLNRNRMGAGKTVETVIACRERDFDSIIILCPKATIGQWVDQFERWWPQRVKDIERNFGKSINCGKIYIVNYEKLMGNSAKACVNLFTSHFDCIVADECHYLRNRNAKRTVAAKALKATCRWGLTGTPILRNPADLWSILDFLNKEYCSASYWDFVNYYCNVHEGFFGKEIVGLTTDESHAARLRRIIDKVSCYNNLGYLSQGTQRIPVPLEMGGKQKKLFKDLRKLAFEELSPEVSIPNGAVLATRLLQATGCPQTLGVDDWGIKFEWIAELLNSNPDLKIVVYSKFVQVIKLLSVYLNMESIKHVVYHGGLNGEERKLAKLEFINEKSCRAILASIGSMGTGVDGLQKVCHVCVFIDRDPLPEINSQCIGRLERDGQREEVLCYFLECVKTLDSKVARVNLSRAEDIRRALSE